MGDRFSKWQSSKTEENVKFSILLWKILFIFGFGLLAIMKNSNDPDTTTKSYWAIEVELGAEFIMVLLKCCFGTGQKCAIIYRLKNV